MEYYHISGNLETVLGGLVSDDDDDVEIRIKKYKYTDEDDNEESSEESSESSSESSSEESSDTSESSPHKRKKSDLEIAIEQNELSIGKNQFDVIEEEAIYKKLSSIDERVASELVEDDEKNNSPVNSPVNSPKHSKLLEDDDEENNSPISSPISSPKHSKLLEDIYGGVGDENNKPREDNLLVGGSVSGKSYKRTETPRTETPRTETPRMEKSIASDSKFTALRDYLSTNI